MTRRLGDFYRSGDWSDYWRTAVSRVDENGLLIRGYPIEEIVDRLTFSETAFLTIRGELPSISQARVLDAVLSSIPAHQWVAAHLLAAAVTASGNPESPIPGIASGILAMGSVTVSPQETAALIETGLELRSQGLSEHAAAARVVDDRLRAGRLIPGLGHPNHKDHDPRATALASVAQRETVWSEGCAFYTAVHRYFVESSGRRLPINIDGMIACVLWDLGFTPLEMAGIAAVAALPGIVAHVVEEITLGVPLRIVPEALGSRYVGPDERHIPAS